MKANQIHNWLLEDEAQQQELLQQLRGKYELSDAHQSTQRVTYLDTFDWRIWRKGDVLEYHEFNRQKKLVWRRIDHSKIYMEIPVDECPDFINDIPDWLMPEALFNVTRPRALVEQALSRIQQHVYEIRDRSGKVIGRLNIVEEHLRKPNNRTSQALPTRLYAEPMRGYDKAFAKVERIITDVGIKAYGKDPLVRLLKLDERSPCDYSMRLRLQLDPGQRADEAARQIMLQLIRIMEINEHGIRDDVDTEFLHDYRSALHRVHRLLGQLKQVIPEDSRQRFDDDLVWVEAETARLYELNNWLLGFDKYRMLVDAQLQLYLDELQGWLRTQRHAALVSVVKILDSDHYRKFMKRWRVFLECGVPDHSVLKRAERPVLEVTSRRVWKTYQELLAYKETDLPRLLQIDLAKMDRLAETLNDLMVLLTTVSPGKQVRALYADMQQFSQALGKCVAQQRQIQTLRGLVRDLSSRGLQEEKAGAAMEELLNCMLDRQSACLMDLNELYHEIAGKAMYRRYESLFRKS